MAYFLKLLQELIQHLSIWGISQTGMSSLEQDLARLLALQTDLQTSVYPNVSDDDYLFFIELGMRYDLILNLDHNPVPLWVAWVGLSTEMGYVYEDWRFADLLVRCASQLRLTRVGQPVHRVAVFGSSFNPITLGHIDLIRVLLNHHPSELSTVVVLPARQSPLKPAETYASVSDRLQLIDRVLQAELPSQDYARIRVEMTEIVRPSPSWMVMTLAALILIHRARETYVLVCGYDHLLSMQHWYRWQALAGLCELWFYPRIGIEIVNEATVDGCSALCQAGIQVTIVLPTTEERDAFAAVCQHRSPGLLSRLHLVVDQYAQIRSTSSTAIRSYYQTATYSCEPPTGLSAVAHEYIMAHQCYLHNSATTTLTKNSKTTAAKGEPPGTR